MDEVFVFHVHISHLVIFAVLSPLLCPSYWQKAAKSEPELGRTRPWHPTCLDLLNHHRCSTESSKSWTALFCRESPATAGP